MENLQTCLSGQYHSLCDYSALTPEQREWAIEARRRENLHTCLSGQYPSLCNRSLLSQSELKEVVEAERQVNLQTCLSGKYKSLCQYGLLSKSELQQTREAERRENLRVCLSGSYPTLCSYSLLTDSERAQVKQAEAIAAERARQLQESRPTVPSRRSADGYLIEVVYDDELLITNGEKYEAKTYCLGWEEGEEVLFIEGSPYGVCVSAKLYNLNRRESCNVWCE